MNKNPFSSEVIIRAGDNQEHKLNFYTGLSGTAVLDAKDIQQMGKRERSKWLFKFIGEKIKLHFDNAYKRFVNPLLSKTQDATTFLLAQKTNLSGDDTAEVYQLLNLLSNKRPYVGRKAASLLEQKVINPQIKVIVQNYFKFNPEAQSRYPALNLVLKDDNEEG